MLKDHPVKTVQRRVIRIGPVFLTSKCWFLRRSLSRQAGHCTEAPAAHVEIWFDNDVQSGIPDNGYPYEGVVVLHKPYRLKTYATLPNEDALDRLKPSASTTFTAVGYGLQQAFPDAAAWKENNIKVRMVAYPHLLQINTGFTGDGSLVLSNNTNTGGTCFGDSGGPNFIGNSNVIGGVTSFGINGTCGGTGGVYRIDRFVDLDWLYGFIGK